MNLLKYLPNSLTVLRLLLAIPLGVLILKENYSAALGVGFIAGVSDALDGYAARKLGVFSRFGAALDPVADKILVTVAFLCFAQVELVPLYLAAIVIGRDLVIVCGALCYHWLVGPFDFAATRLSKFNMVVQIIFCVLLLAAQLITEIPGAVVAAGTVAVLAIAIASGLDYVVTWSVRAIQQGRGEH